MLESMIENNTATRAEINDIATAIFQGADTVMLSAEAAIGKFPTQAVSTMTQTILSTEKYKREHIEDFKNSIITNKDPVKSILLSVKDMAYNPDVKAIIVFSNSGKSAKLVSAMRPAAKIVTISPNINVYVYIWGNSYYFSCWTHSRNKFRRFSRIGKDNYGFNVRVISHIFDREKNRFNWILIGNDGIFKIFYVFSFIFFS